MKHGKHSKGGHPDGKMPATTKDNSQSKANSAASSAKSGKGSKGGGKSPGGLGGMDY